jgi:hypothetical protein
MSRTSKLAALASASAAAALAVAVTATPALAWTADDFTATLDGNMTIDAGGIQATCTSSTLSGTIASDGTLSIDDASVGGCGVPVDAGGLSWAGSLNASTGAATISGFEMSAAGCTFAGDLSGSFTGSDLPVSVTFDKQVVNSTGGWLCFFSSATVTATYDFAPA